MVDLIADPREKFIELVDLDQSRVQLEPHIMFVCGGPVDIKELSNHSIRNMFMNLSGGLGDRSKGFILAENFEDWNNGYRSLSDFENDIAFISSLVVVFLESAGALTEFGLFFANKAIRDKLIVVLHDDFHKSKSFIKLGLLDPLEHENQESVRVYKIDHRDIENVKLDEVKDILDDVLEHCDSQQKSEKFDRNDRGHQIFMIYQVLDLFLALTKSEIISNLNSLGIGMLKKDLDAALYILQKFRLIGIEKKSSTYFYFVPTGLPKRVELYFSKVVRRFDAATIRIEVNEFYKNASKSDKKHKQRMKVIENAISGSEI